MDMDAPELPISTQVALFGLNRTGLYYQPVPSSEDDLMVKAYIDKIYTVRPFCGYRRICRVLNNEHALGINHKTALRHMHEMGIQAIYPCQDTIRPRPGNPIYPYLLKGMKIDLQNQAWFIDITYIPIRTDWL